MSKLLVILPGGFHPYHAGHFALYQSAKKNFPNSDIYVAATDDQSERPFPFKLKEKLAKLAGVEPGHFIQVKSPFRAEEITKNYDPNSDVLVFVRSEKDRNEQPKPGGTKKDGSPAYFQPWTGKNLQPFSKHAYLAYLPTVTFGPGIRSATEIRKAWPTLNDKRKLALVMSLYPATQQNIKLAQNVVKMFDQVMGNQEVSENINDSKNKQSLYWSDLDEGLSVHDKMNIIEEFYTTGNLTESNTEDTVKYFKSLISSVPEPIKNKKYITAPLLLVNSKIMMLDKPSYMEFLGKGRDGLVFKSSIGQTVYPAKALKDTTLYHVFTFLNQQSYDKFRTIMKLKFEIDLPMVTLTNKIDESEITNIAKRMIDKYKDSSYSAYERANGHAMNYESNDPKYKYWTQIADEIKKLEKTNMMENKSVDYLDEK